MKFSRRGFLKYFGAASVATAAGIEIIDTAKTFFLPPVGGWRESDWFGNYNIVSYGPIPVGNRLLTLDEMVQMLHEQQYKPKIGPVINVRRPPRYMPMVDV